MSNVKLRRSGGSLVVAVPRAFVVKNGLDAGSSVDISITSDELVIRPARPKYTLAALLEATPKEARVPGWDEMESTQSEGW